MEEFIGYLDEEYNIVLDQDQPIVRCKDCLLSDTRWSPMHGIVVRYCRRFAEVYGEAYRVEDNGFCAWGKPREGEQE